MVGIQGVIRSVVDTLSTRSKKYKTLLDMFPMMWCRLPNRRSKRDNNPVLLWILI